MSVKRVAMLSVHTSPLDQPGTGDGGGMNVYVQSLARALARAGVSCDVLTRAEHRGAAADRRRGAGVPGRAPPRRCAGARSEGRTARPRRRPGRRGAPSPRGGGTRRRPPRALLDLRRRRAPAQARARTAARDDVPHAGAHQGRGRDRRRPRRAPADRDRDRRLYRPDHRVVPGRARSSSSRRYGAPPNASRSFRPASTMRSSRWVTAARPGNASACPIGRCSCSWGASNDSRVSISRWNHSPHSTTTAPCSRWSVVRAGPTGPRRSPACTSLAQDLGSRGSRAMGRAAASRRARRLVPRRERVCRPVAHRVVRVGRARGVGVWHARSSPPRWAVCARSSTTGRPATSSTGGMRRAMPRRSSACSTIPTWPTRMGRSAANLSRRYAWTMTAARLRRLYADLDTRELVRCM